MRTTPSPTRGESHAIRGTAAFCSRSTMANLPRAIDTSSNAIALRTCSPSERLWAWPTVSLARATSSRCDTAASVNAIRKITATCAPAQRVPPLARAFGRMTPTVQKTLQASAAIVTSAHG